MVKKMISLFLFQQHGSLAKVGKVRDQTRALDVEKEEKARKKPTGRAKKRKAYNRRFVETAEDRGDGRRRGPNSNQ